MGGLRHKGVVTSLLLFAAACVSSAGTITVTPSDMNGWVIAMFTRGTAKCGFYSTTAFVITRSPSTVASTPVTFAHVPSTAAAPVTLMPAVRAASST